MREIRNILRNQMQHGLHRSSAPAAGMLLAELRQFTGHEGLHGGADGPQVARTGDAIRARFNRSDGRHQQAGQDCDDRHHQEQLDQGEGGAPQAGDLGALGRGGVCRGMWVHYHSYILPVIESLRFT